jgi:AAA domain
MSLADAGLLYFTNERTSFNGCARKEVRSMITHVHMKMSDVVARAGYGEPQQRVGTDTPADVVANIRYETITEDPPGLVVVMCPYEEVQERFEDYLLKDRVDMDRVMFLHATPIEKTISVAGIPAHEVKLINGAGKTEYSTLVEETPIHKETITMERRLHLGTPRNMRDVKKHLKEAGASMLVIIDPNEAEGDLKYLPELLKECPHLDVVIYHRYCEKWGVIYEGGEVDPASTWDTRSEVESEQDLPPVIKGIAHEGESTWVGGLPKVGKTWLMLCILLALLTGLPLFGDERLTVPHKAKRCIYLCPEAGRGSIKKRLKMLGLIEHLYDPITHPDGALYLQTLSKGKKIALTDPVLLELVKDADVFIDTAVRYLEGDENAVKDVRVLTENILNLLAVGARSVWVAHHAPKGFENASNMSLQNMFRGSGEYGAALTNAYGVCTEDEATTKIRFHCITGRDLDEHIPDMILQGRPYLFETGNFKVVETNAAPYKSKAGAPGDSLKQQKIEFLKTLSGSNQEKVEQLNVRFGTAHDRSIVSKWLPTFDANKGQGVSHE